MMWVVVHGRRKGLSLVWISLVILSVLAWHLNDGKDRVWIANLLSNYAFSLTSEKNTVDSYEQQHLNKHDFLHIWESPKKTIRETALHSVNTLSKSKGQTTESDRNKVLIISRGRSGSSFLGKLFDENRKVLYLFEPLGSLAFREDRRNDTKTFDILAEIYSCQTVDNVYLDFLLKNESFRLRSGRLLPFSTRCTLFPKRPCLAQLLKKACNEARGIVTKVLTHRLPRGGLWGIKKFMTRPANWNLKIIHLIRDPRRVVHSMMEAGWFRGKNFSEKIQQVCDSVWKNMEYVRKNAMFFEGRYKLVLFREMIKNPFSTIVSLYEFLEMTPVPDSVFSWIVANTKKSLFNRAYSTSRNSTAVLNKKINFTEEESVVIEKYCSRVINVIETYQHRHN